MGNNTEKNIIGGGDFSLIAGATEAPVDEAGYDAVTAAFGNIVNISPNNESSKVEHMGSYKGVKIRDDIFITSIKQGFKLTCDEFDEFLFRALFFADAGVDHTDADFTKYVPLSAANSLKGYGRLQIYDGRSPTVPVIKFIDFHCIIRLSTMPTFDGENYSSYEVEVDVLADVGNVIVKKRPTPAP